MAALLGASIPAQVLAAAFALSIPAGILEATSTQNDYVVAFWLVCLAYLTLRGKLRALSPLEELAWGLALGLALLTKGTSYPYALPFAVWHFLPLGRSALPKTLRRMAAALLAVTVLNAGYWARNVVTYGIPLGAASHVTSMTAVSLQPGPLLYAWIRNLALNLPTPSPAANDWIVGMVRSIAGSLGSDPGEFNMIWAWNNENLAGNPLHYALVAAALIGLLLFGRARRDRRALVYASVAGLSVLCLFSVISFDLYGARHQLPFLVLWAPVIGAAAAHLRSQAWTRIAAVSLLLMSLPWVLLNASRPLIGWRPRTMTESILVEPPEVILFANWTNLHAPFAEATELIRESGCRDVGLRIDSGDIEYAFWWLLDAPQSGIRLEQVDPYPHLARYAGADFTPCAILCTVCGGRTTLYGLEVAGQFPPVSVFLGNGYTSDIDS